jgi:uncharacterized protein (DUF736 family)
MHIGTFHRQDSLFCGEITTISLCELAVVFVPAKKRRHGDPDFILIKGEGVAYEVGNARIRKTWRGETFFAVTLDCPLFPEAVRANLEFTSEDRAELIWHR